VNAEQALYGAFFVKGFGGATHLFSFIGFFVRSQGRFFIPTRPLLTAARAGAVKVGRRTNLSACSALARPYLDGSEHDGTLDVIGITIRGELAIGRGSSRRNLVFGRSTAT
jgi:hypothetical protein